MKAHFKAKHKAVWETVAAAEKEFEKEKEERKKRKSDGTRQLSLVLNKNNNIQVQVVNHCLETQRRWDKAVVQFLCQTFSSLKLRPEDVG